eukprot:TRINITY_DN2435_c0_g1_i2.p2 TRINITY_DN2435_c0_g1~~TRINITY_DN2435_c0_g1_i2.p2  ORF type:complete len:192 (+),score=12.57 TRINITY_DN2435_c0_g1_i2:57-578(+)
MSETAAIATTVGVMACLLICCALPLHITSTVLGFMEHSKCHNMSIDNPLHHTICTCDNTDPMGLNVSQYLIGLGLAGIIQVTLIFLSCGLRAGENQGCCLIMFGGTSVCAAMFGFAWFIVGAVILFRSNTDCIGSKSVHVIYALVMWCFSAFEICNNAKSSRKNDTQNQPMLE